MKIVLILILIGTVVAASPQFGFGGFAASQSGFSGFAGFGGVGIFPNSQFYQALLDRDLQTLLATPDFPDDLALRAVEAVANADTGFESCDSTAYPFPFMQRICIKQTYAAARNALSAITQEAQTRAESTTMTSANQPVEVQTL